MSNLGSGHPLSPLARLPGRPSRPSRAAEHSVLGRLMVRPGWRPLAVAHTHADWIGHCTPCSSASEQGNCVHSVRCSYILPTYPIGYGLTQPRVHLGYRIVMFDTRKAIWIPLF
ncbi:hypothetical protein ALC53_03282 [Atta colombica]|uniref:Uncharacterized protein n=1 Tax=Atta colombica TaxID=520822 RepID=A0A195BNP9_9HYME|nr:hypothetical protein ALC53_03282 [Atta colombica]